MSNYDSTSVEVIRGEYRRINQKWMRLQLNALLGMTIFAMVIEIAMYFVADWTGMIQIANTTYLWKYIAAPSGVNFLFVWIGFIVKRSAVCSDLVKIYAVSLTSVAVAFSVYNAHSLFFSLGLVLTIPMLLTTAYGNLPLTTVVAVCTIVLKGISDLWIGWNPAKISVDTSSLTCLDFVMSLLLLAVFYAGCLIVIHIEKEKNEVSIQKEIERLNLQKAMLTDSLTQIQNRHGLRQAFDTMLKECDTVPYHLSILDLDNFKQVNDTFGHQTGDQCLEEFGKILRETCIKKGSPFRFGGDEFCILFRGISVEEIMETCREIQRRYAGALQKGPQQIPFFTISFGIVAYRPGMTPAQMIREADEALYGAKLEKDKIKVYMPSKELI